MKRVWSDGTGAIELSPLELAEKLAAIIPPPRANRGCPSCGERMHLRAVVDGGGAPTRILSGLLRPRGPPVAPPGGEGRGVYAGG